MRFNVPPGWPPHYQDGDRVDPTWPAAPDGWVWWSPVPQPPMLPPVQVDPANLRGRSQAVGWVIVGFSAIVVLGAWLPWDEFQAFTFELTPYVPTPVTVAGGLIGVAAGLVRAFGREPSGWQLVVPICTLIVGAFVSGIAAHDWAHLRVEDVGTGIGLLLTWLGGVGLVIASIVGIGIRLK
jgi:hypothetical protein